MQFVSAQSQQLLIVTHGMAFMLRGNSRQCVDRRETTVTKSGSLGKTGSSTCAYINTEGGNTNRKEGGDQTKKNNEDKRPRR